MEKSRNTLEGITREHGQLQMNLEKVHLKKGGGGICTWVVSAVIIVRSCTWGVKRRKLDFRDLDMSSNFFLVIVLTLSPFLFV